MGAFNMKFVVAFLLMQIVFLLPLSVFAFDGDFSGSYKSLNGELEHVFSETGDYAGKVVRTDKQFPYLGLYRAGDGICWFPEEDGSKGLSGNVVLYYGEVQCCLQFQKISDKIAVTFVWNKPYGSPMGLCSNQVLRKTE